MDENLERVGRAKRQRQALVSALAITIGCFQPSQSAFTLDVTHSRLAYATYLPLHLAGSTSTVLRVDRTGNIFIAGIGRNRNGSVGFVVKLTSNAGRILLHVELPGRIDSMALDRSDDLFVSGLSSAAWLTHRRCGSGTTPFVAKLSPHGKLLYSRCIGPSTTLVNAMAVDSTGQVTVTGSTRQRGFPLVRPLQRRFGGAFITKLDARGRTVYSTFLGGSEGTVGYGIALDRSGNTLVVGSATSRSFRSRHSLAGTHCSRPASAFLVRVNGRGNRLLSSTCLQGALASRIALDLSGDIYVITESALAKLNSRATRVMFRVSTPGTVHSLAVDGRGNSYMTGGTTNPKLRVVRPLQAHLHRGTCGPEVEEAGACADAFVAEVSRGGRLVFSSYLGGSRDDIGNAIGVREPGTVILTGLTESSDFPWRHALGRPSSRSVNEGVVFVAGIGLR